MEVAEQGGGQERFLTRSILDWRRPRGERAGAVRLGRGQVSAHLGSAGLVRPWAARAVLRRQQRMEFC